MLKRMERKMERGLLVAVVMSVFLLMGIYLWSLKRRDWLYARWHEVSAIDNVPAARRYLDGYLRRIERAGLVRGDTDRSRLDRMYHDRQMHVS